MARQAVTQAPTGSPQDIDEDHFLLEQLRQGNEEAFGILVDRYANALFRLAFVYVKTPTVAEEVVQETWLAVLTGLHHFRGESPLKSWIFRILTNRAKTRAQRERRTLPFSSLETVETDGSGPAVDPDCFLPADQPWLGWPSLPSVWRVLPEEHPLYQETLRYLEKGIATLPTNQREILLLRDIEGWTAEETCRFLGISDGNQRVILHRARSKMRALLERYFKEE